MIALPIPEWVTHPARDQERAARLSRDLGMPLPVAHALVNRGIDSPETAVPFLEPSIDDLHDPFELKDLDRAVARIRSAVDADESILIHGDYDVDGMTSTYLLLSVLRELGANVEYRIPHRTRDGYGLSVSGVEYARRRGHRLIVTVDSGITAVEPVQLAGQAGIDVVITDHHEPPAELPRAFAVVNPHQPGCPYPFKSLAGVGVAFKLAEALLRGRGGLERARSYLDVVALGTIADVVPLVGENRVLARYGLEALSRTPRLGLRALIELAGLEGKSISGGQVAFLLAPRINAAGRMGNAEQGVRLLEARDADEAQSVASSLEEDNELRRQHDEQALEDAARRVETELSWPDCASIVLWSSEWHPGVIGIVASRLVERFHRPTFLIALDKERGRGSGRSIRGFDVSQALVRCDDLLDAHGGHAFAAGLTIQRGRLEAFRDRFETLVREFMAPEDMRPELKVDSDVQLSECDLELVRWVDRLSPHGLGNAEPVFCVENVTIDEATVVGNGRHLKLRVRDESGRADAIGFGMGDRYTDVVGSGRCDLAFLPMRNDWMGSTRVQLKLKGVKVP